MASGWAPEAGYRLTSKTLLLLVSILLLRGAPCGRGNPIPQPLPRQRPPATGAPGGPASAGTEEPSPPEQGGDAAMQSVLENLKEQFLRTFNLSGSGGGGGGGSRVEPPEYMVALYNRFANDHSAMPTANIIRSFKNEASLGGVGTAEVRRHPLLFNVSVPHHERITAAELRLYTLVQNDRHLYAGVDRRVTVYELGPPDDGAAGDPPAPPPRGDSPRAPPSDPEPAELASRQVYGVDDGWEAFDLTAAVQRWRRSESGTTHRLEVHITSLAPEGSASPDPAVGGGGAGPPPEGDMQLDTSPEEKHKPLLIVFSNDQSGDDRQDRHELNEMIDHETSDLVLQRDNLELGLNSLWGAAGRREDGDEEPDEEELIQMRTNAIYDTTSRIRRNAKGSYCKRQPLFVEFKDIGWDSWILAPTGYNAFECSGVCTYPLTKHVTPTKHAIVQALVNINSPQKAAKACCVPTKLEPISLLYLDDTGVVTYKYKYEGMMVAECGCR